MTRGVGANQAMGVIIPTPLTSTGYYGLTLEPAATNYVIYSENFAQWTNFSSQASINFTGLADPAGGTTAYDVSVGAGLTGLYTPCTYAGSEQTVSCWLNAFAGAGAGASTGAVVIEGSNGYVETGYQGLPFPTPNNLGWSRFWLPSSFNDAPVQVAIGDRAGAFPGVNTRAQYAFIQVETTPYPTSYIPTTSSTASRAATTLAWTPNLSNGSFNITIGFAMALSTGALSSLAMGFTILSDSTGTKTIGFNSSGQLTSTLGGNTVTDPTPLSWPDTSIMSIQIIANGSAKTYTANIQLKFPTTPFTYATHSFTATHSGVWNMGTTIYIGSSPTGTNMIPVDGLLSVNEILGTQIF
jgi:hypothetical protein